MNKAQQAFVDALLQLMQEKPFEQISASQLSRLAQYDRRTYYRYFKTKKDVLYLYCSSLLGDLALEMRKEPLTPYSGFLSFFEFWNEHRDFLLIMEKQHLLYYLGSEIDSLIYRNVGIVVHKDLPDNLEQISEFSQFAYYFTLGGCWQVLIFWIRSGMKQTPEQMTRHILQIFSEMQKMNTESLPS